MPNRSTKHVDWEQVEREYRAGSLSIRAIAARHAISEGAIRARAKKEGWAREYSSQVRRRTRDSLAEHAAEQSGAPKAAKGRYDASTVIESAAEEAKTVVLNHRKDIKHARFIVKMLREELEFETITREKLEELIAADIDDTPEKERKKRTALLNRVISLPQRASALRDLSTSLDRLIKLERQAYSMDEKEDDEHTYEEILKSLHD